jgi:hypothetical protein
MPNIIKKAVFALIIFVVFGEWGLGLFKKQVKIFYPSGKTFPPIYIESDTQTFKLRPDTDAMHYNYFNEFVKQYHITTKGIRGYTEDGDIIMAGDSFIFGIGLNDDETVPYYLEKISGRKVVNAGIPGYSIDNSYIALQEYKPDKIAIVGFFLGNDIRDIKKHTWVVDENGLPVKIMHRTLRVDSYHHLTEGSSSSFPLKEFLRNHSFFYTVLSEHRHVLKWKLALLRKKIQKFIFFSGNKKHEKPDEALAVNLDEDEYVAKIRKLFRAMKEKRDKFLVLLISSRPPPAPETRLKKYIIDFFNTEGIHFICPPIGPDSLYYDRDCHWTKNGSRHVALLIHQKLGELCWQ